MAYVIVFAGGVVVGFVLMAIMAAAGDEDRRR